MGRKPTTTTTDAIEGRPTPLTGARTSTLTKGEQPAVTLAPRTPSTSLRFYGRKIPPFALTASKRAFTIGAGACDLVIDRTVSKKVSGFHATLTRTPDALRIEDQGSKNGCFASLDAPRLASFDAPPGRSFWLADVQLLPMNTYLEVLRPRLAWCLGLDREEAIDEAIETIAAGGPLALVGPPGTEGTILARAIHDASAQRDNFFLAITSPALPSLDGAVGGTVMIDLDRLRKLPGTYCAQLFDEGRGLRVIAVAANNAKVRARLDTYRKQLTTIPLPALTKRPKDVLRLIAMDWIARGSRRRVEDLGAGISGMTSARWRRNLEDLRAASERLLALLEHGSVRAAARALGITHQSLLGHFRRIGYAVPEMDG